MLNNSKLKKYISVVVSIAYAFSILTVTNVFAVSDFDISNGWLVAYNGTSTEVVVPKEVSVLYHPAFNTKAMTKIEFESESILSQIGDGMNPVVPNPLTATKLQVILPVRDGITIKAWSFWTSGEVTITDPNMNTIYEDNLFYIGDGKKKIIAPLSSKAYIFATANNIAFEEYSAIPVVYDHSDNADMTVINACESITSILYKQGVTVSYDNTVSLDQKAFKIIYNADALWSYIYMSTSTSEQTLTDYEGIAYWINTKDKDVNADLTLFDSDGEKFIYNTSKPFYLMSDAKELTKISTMQLIPKNFKGYVLYPYTSIKKDVAQDLNINGRIDKVSFFQLEFRGEQGEVFIDDVGVVASIDAFALSHSSKPLDYEEPTVDNDRNAEQPPSVENKNTIVGNSGANIDNLFNIVNYIPSVAKDVSPDKMAYKFEAKRTNPASDNASFEMKLPLKTASFANAQGIVFWIKNFNSKIKQYINVIDTTSIPGVDLIYNINESEYYYYIENGVEKAGKGNLNLPAGYEGFVLIPYKSFNYYYATDDTTANKFPKRKGTIPVMFDRAYFLIYPDFKPVLGKSFYIDDIGVYHNKKDFLASHTTKTDTTSNNGPLYIVNDCEDLANIAWSTNVKIEVTKENAKEGNNYKVTSGTTDKTKYSIFQPNVIIPDEETHKSIKGIAYWVTGFKGKTNSLMQGPEQVIGDRTETFTYDTTKPIYFIDKDGNLFEKKGNEVILDGFTGYIIYPYDSFRFYYDTKGVSTGTRKLTKISKLSFGIYTTPENVAGVPFFVDNISYFTSLEAVFAKYVKAKSSFEQPVGPENKGMVVGNSGSDLSTIASVENAKTSISNVSPDKKGFRYDFAKTSETNKWFASSINIVNKTIDWKNASGLCFWFQPTTKLLAELSVTAKDSSEAVPEIFNPYNKKYYYIDIDGVRIESQGSIAPPEGFKGWIIIPLDSFDFYYKIGEGSSNSKLDRIDSIELYMQGYEHLVGDYMVLDDFSVYNSLEEITKLLAPNGIVNIDKSAVAVELDVTLTTNTSPLLTDYNKELKMRPIKSGDIKTTSAILRWNNKSGVKTYKINVYEKTGDSYKFVKTAVAKTQDGSTKINSLKKATEYTIQISACDPWGETLADGYYEPLSFKTLAKDADVYIPSKNNSSTIMIIALISVFAVISLLLLVFWKMKKRKNESVKRAEI